MTAPPGELHSESLKAPARLGLRRFGTSSLTRPSYNAAGRSPMRTRFAAQLAALSLILTAVPLMAHDSFDGEYDRNKTVSLVGKMVDVEWVNPHCRLMISVT